MACITGCDALLHRERDRTDIERFLVLCLLYSLVLSRIPGTLEVSILRYTLQFIALLAMLIMTLGCDISSPEAVAQSTSDALAPYFPNVHTIVNTQAQQVTAFTCISGAGPQLVEDIKQSLITNPSLGKFNQLRTFSAFTGGQSYHFFVLGFERDLIVYNVDQRTLAHRTVSNSDLPNWSAAYRRQCDSAE
jgi:hypothetical protein